MVQKTLQIRETLEGLAKGMQSKKPQREPLFEVIFARRAGNVTALHEFTSKAEIMQLLRRTERGGTFAVIGHGGHSHSCGMINAGIDAHIDQTQLPADQHTSEKLRNSSLEVRLIAEAISERAIRLGTPNEPGITNAWDQVSFIFDYPEAWGIVKRQNITLVAVNIGEHKNTYRVINNSNKPSEELMAFCERMQLDLREMHEKDELIPQHADAILVFSPVDLVSIRFPNSNKYSVTGVLCSDSRLQGLRTIDGPASIMNVAPNRFSMVSILFEDGTVHLSRFAVGSVLYGLENVHGVKDTRHTIVVGTPNISRQIQTALMENERICKLTEDGRTLSVVQIDPRNGSLTLTNRAEGIHLFRIF